MADDLTNTGPADDRRVSTQAHEIRYWTSKWKISETTLREAVAVVGVMVVDVERWLRANGHIN